MVTWPDLYARRWDWSENTLAWLRHEVQHVTGDPDHHRVAHVMVIGDSQAGKTTLLVRLMGITDDEALREAESVLRAGRRSGSSSTSIPIRYRWSDDPDRWLLVRDSTGHGASYSSDELRGLLADYRSADGRRLRWQLGDRPLEIGLPTRLSGGQARHELRVLDVPGLFAASQEEQETAEAIVSHFAPTMTVRIFVQPANKMADAFNDRAIRDNVHLSGWATSTKGHRVVLTHAFSDHSVRRWLHDWLQRSEGSSGDTNKEALADFCRAQLAEELAGSLLDEVDKNLLANMLYPVDVGDSAVRLRTEPTIDSANRLVIERLGKSIEADSSDDGYHLAVPDFAFRVVELTRRHADERTEGIAGVRTELATARDQLADDDRMLQTATSARDEAARLRSKLGQAVDNLSRRSVPYERPSTPSMTGLAVRESQAAERKAWYEAGVAMWTTWRFRIAKKVIPYVIADRTPITEKAIADRYDETVECCGLCTESRWRRFWGDKTLERPEYCYARMSDVEESMTAWIRETIVSAAKATMSSANATYAELEDRHTTVRRVRDRSQASVRVLEKRLAAMETADADAKRSESRDLKNAGRVMHELDRNNELHVNELLSQFESAGKDERGWLTVAVLRSLYDLGRMTRNR